MYVYFIEIMLPNVIRKSNVFDLYLIFFFFNIFNPWTYRMRCSFCAFIFGGATYFEKTIFSFSKTHINVNPAFHIITATT